MIGKIKNYFNQTFSSLKIRNFKLYFFGQGVSMLGNWMQSVALAWLVVELTGSGTMLGTVLACQYLPILFLAPWGGVLVDRYPKRKILFISQSILLLITMTLGILVVTNLIQLWMIFVLALCIGLVVAVDNPVRHSFTFEMVGKEHITNAVTLNTMQANVARIIGPAVAGGIILAAGIGWCFVINSFSFAAVLFVLLIMNKKELINSPLTKNTKGQLMAGLVYVKSVPILRNTLVILAIVGTLTYEFSVSLPLVAKFVFAGNAATFATLTSAMGIGAVIGGLMVAGRKVTAPHTFVVAAFMFGLSVVLAAVMPSVMLTAIVMIVVGICSINFASLGNSILQLSSAPEMRGRVMSLWAVAFLGSTAIGGPIIGWVGENAGARYALAFSGIAALIAAGIGALTLLKKDMAHTSLSNKSIKVL